MNPVKRDAVLTVVAVALLFVVGLSVLRANREIGPIVPDTQVSMSSSHAACGAFCWMLISWLFEQGTQMAAKEIRRNDCNGACGGGGGGGFECAPDDRSCNTMNTW